MNETTKSVSIKQIISYCHQDIIQVFGEYEDMHVLYLREPAKVDIHTLDWINLRRNDKQQMAENSPAIVMITDSTVNYSEKLRLQKKILIQVENPKLVVAKIGNHFFKESLQPTIHKTAIIHPRAKIGNNVYIGPYVTIGRCIIGDNSQIHQHTVIEDNTTIKGNCIIHSNVILGTDGLGCEREKNGSLVKFPHFGGVVVEEMVEIGTGSIVAKGALSDTIIGTGTKINVGCFIAHNAVIGKNNWISPKVNIAGSVRTGNNTTIFSGSIIREQSTIGNYVTIGMGAVVTKNIPDKETWIGNPAHKLEK